MRPLDPNTEDPLERALIALRYIARPTMGLPAEADPVDYALHHATEDAVRIALRSCIEIARMAVRDIEGEIP